MSSGDGLLRAYRLDRKEQGRDIFKNALEHERSEIEKHEHEYEPMDIPWKQKTVQVYRHCRRHFKIHVCRQELSHCAAWLMPIDMPIHMSIRMPYACPCARVWVDGHRTEAEDRAGMDVRIHKISY